jgi:DNA-binding transcriptional ArsR family regulator
MWEDAIVSESGVSERVRRFLKALANENRQEIMMLFIDGRELTVGTVAELQGIGQSTASIHLSKLREGGILTSRRDGKTVYYRADTTASTAALAELQAYLASCCPPTID